MFERINAAVNQFDRQQAGRELLPPVLCIDSQYVKLAPLIGEHRGSEAHKLVNGRKRTYAVDTQGRLWVADVDAANGHDGTLAEPLIMSILWRCGERLEKIFGDQAYNGSLLPRWSSGALTLRKRRGPNRPGVLYQLPSGGSLSRSAGAAASPGRISSAG